MIEIKTLFSGWKETDIETARKWAKDIKDGCTTGKYKDFLKKHVRGIEIGKLFNEKI